MSTAEIHTVDSAYMIEFKLVSGGLRVEDLSGDTAPHTYHPPYSSYLYYYTEYGVWRRTTGNGKWEFSSDKTGCGRDYRPVIIRECEIPQEMKGKHYDCIVMDDIIEKEVKGKMTNKSLFHVILFNRKTEEIEFDRIQPASNEQDAVMQAAQLYGKYDSKVHLTIVWQLQYSEYATID